MEHYIHTYADNDNYHSKIEFATDVDQEVYMFLHVDVFNWNRSVLTQIKEDMENVCKNAWDKGFDYIFAYNKDESEVKFCNLIKPISGVETFNNNTRNLVFWDLEELGYGD